MSEAQRPDTPAERAATLALSRDLQDVGRRLDFELAGIAGQRVSFQLFVSVGLRTHYVINCSRAESIALLETVLARWKEGEGDAPPHQLS